MSEFAVSIPSKHYTYVQSAEPSDPEEGETWYDDDADDGADDAFLYTGSQWTEMTIDDLAQLSGTTEDALHEWPISASGLSFDPATQSEVGSVASDLSNHADDADAHHAKTPEYTDSDALAAVNSQIKVLDASNKDGLSKLNDGDTSNTYAVYDYLDIGRATAGCEIYFALGSSDYNITTLDGSETLASGVTATGWNTISFSRAVPAFRIEAPSVRLEMSELRIDGGIQ